jgi:hypothetical protein
MCEAGINIKVIQDTLGHQDISTHTSNDAESCAERNQSHIF